MSNRMKPEVAAAIIGVIGSIAVAIISNSGKTPTPPEGPKPSEKRPPIDAASRSITSGHAIVYDGHTRYELSGFSFGEKSLVGWGSGRADLLVEHTGDIAEPAHFFLQYDTGERDVSGSPFDAGAKSGIAKVDSNNPTDVPECPLTGYATFRYSPVAGGVYCVRARDGVHFAMIKVTDLLTDRIGFDWEYQTESTRRFK